MSLAITELEAYKIFDRLPPDWPEDLTGEIKGKIIRSGRKVVVLDDDPTGTQTVHGVHVLTEWSVASLRDEFLTEAPSFYILTNSRSLTLSEAQSINVEIGVNLSKAARSTQSDFVIVSRSDSTLRGHFPGEMEALAKALETAFHAWLVVPFFLEGGRFTIQDIHYVLQGDYLIPAAETVFARDRLFGYQSSNLPDWIEEKFGGRIRSDQVASITIEDLRQGGPGFVAKKLQNLKPGSICIANAATYRDLEVLVDAVLEREAHNQRFLYRTAASFVRVRAGIQERSLISEDEIALPDTGGGLIIVGSYVPQSTVQLKYLFACAQIKQIEVKVDRLLSDVDCWIEIEHVVEQTNLGLSLGETVVIFTSRKLITSDEIDATSDSWIGRRISECLVNIVRDITERPRYILAKGGITSSDVATKGLGVIRAMVVGQILPGVPVWQLGAECRFPGLQYIVFPGNVGGPNALVEIIGKLERKTFGTS